MWLLYARGRAPDAPYWPGRRWLAAIDAVAWPVGWVFLARHLPEPAGLVGQFLVVVACWLACHRVRVAVWRNHRYRFTSWRWGKVAATLMVIGLALTLRSRP